MTFKDLRPNMPHYLTVIHHGGRTETLNIKRWVDDHPAIQHPSQFYRGRYDRPIGYEWAIGEVLPNFKVEEMLAAKAKDRS